MRKNRLFYIMGPSGSGKDSVINYARNHIKLPDLIVFAHRYITRPSNSGGENHIELSHKEFNIRLKKGVFSMYWRSHDNFYGIGCEVDEFIKKGLDVVVSGSREYFQQALKAYPDLIPVIITASEKNLKQRLLSRNRESSRQIEGRLKRASLFKIENDNAIIIYNDKKLEDAGEKLVEIIKSIEAIALIKGV